MKFSENFRIAVYMGLLIGTAHGVIDILARILKRSFEWFELYQTLLVSILFFLLIFAVIGFVIHIISITTKPKNPRKFLLPFYTLTGIAMLVLFYFGILINAYLLPKSTFWEPISLLLNLPIILFILITYIVLLFKRRDIIINSLNFLKKKRINKIINNLEFVILAFVAVSFLLDLYLYFNIPTSKYNAALENMPNVILIVLDTTRADHMSVYGYEQKTTPNIDKLAKEAVVFDNALSSSSWTLTGHASIFTGQHMSNHKASHNNQMLSTDEITLAEMLKQNDFNTAGFVGAAYTKAKYGMGQGFNTYKDRLDFIEYIHTFDKFSLRESLFTFFPGYKSLLRLDAERTAEETNQFVFRWLEKNKHRPFFIFINYFDPHEPYNLGAELRCMFANDTNPKSYEELKWVTRIERYTYIDNELVGSLIKLYDNEIFYMDFYIGQLFDKLEELGVKDNTIIIITADHGEEFYEHGKFTHGGTLYQEVIKVPLIIYYPKGFDHKRIEKSVSVVDIFPTVLNILNFEVPSNVDGVNLLPLIMKNDYERDYVISELDGRSDIDETKYQKSVIRNEWKLINITQWQNIKSGEEKLPPSLFNLRTDQKERINLYNIETKKREELNKYISD